MRGKFWTSIVAKCGHSETIRLLVWSPLSWYPLPPWLALCTQDWTWWVRLTSDSQVQDSCCPPLHQGMMGQMKRLISPISFTHRWCNDTNNTSRKEKKSHLGFYYPPNQLLASDWNSPQTQVSMPAALAQASGQYQTFNRTEEWLSLHLIFIASHLNYGGAVIMMMMWLIGH